MEITLEKINTRSDPYQLFLDSIRNRLTRNRYKNLLYAFLKLVPNQVYSDSLGRQPEDRDAKTLAAFFVDLARKDVNLASDVIAAYIKEDRKRVDAGEISSQTLPNHIKPIRALLDSNRVPVHWKSLGRLMPRRESKSKASATLGDNIVVYVLDEYSFRDYKNGESVSTYYNSGKIESDTFDLYLGPGTYYVVMSNTYSTFSTKDVALRVIGACS